jgi:hypothetical protein
MIGRHVFGGQLDAFYAPAPAQTQKSLKALASIHQIYPVY